MLKKNIFILTLLSLTLFPFTVESKGDGPPIFYESIRYRGMGGPFIAVSDDQSGIWTNAAGLHQIEEHKRWALLDAHIAWDATIVDMAQDFDDLDDTPIQTARKYVGQRGEIEITNHGYVVTPNNFGIGALWKGTATASVNNYAAPSVDLDARNDFGLVGAFSRPFLGPIIVGNHKAVGNWGAALKFFYREGTIGNFDFADANELDIIKNPRDRANTSHAVSLDLSTIFHLDDSNETKFAIGLYDVFRVDFGDNLEDIDRNLRFGFSFKPLIDNETFKDTTFAMDYDDALTTGDIFNHIRLGAETKFHNWDFRAGLYQGYLSVGVGVHVGFFNLDYANYSHELGPRTGVKDDRMNAFRVGFVF
ncbi:hypothetical protein ACFL35_15490 [Candidatus Riflebacteria bacterium]